MLCLRVSRKQRVYAHVSSEIERSDNNECGSVFKGTIFGDLIDVTSDPNTFPKLARAIPVSFLFETVSTSEITCGAIAGPYDQVVGRHLFFLATANREHCNGQRCRLGVYRSRASGERHVDEKQGLRGMGALV